MSFKKPFRICNEISLAAPDFVATATLKELKDRLELRISIPDSNKYRYSITIADGALQVHEDSKVARDNARLYCSFMLPANVAQNKVTALYRSYGLKIIMPLFPHSPAVIHVPLLTEKE